MKSLFEGLEFKSLISRIPSARGPVGLYPRPMSSLDAAGTRRGAPAPATPRDAASLATLNVTEELDKQVTLILQKMSTTGIIVDLQFLKGLSKDWSKKLQDIEQQIYSIIGHQVNLNSPKQLQVVLFDELKLPVVRKTKTGRSTDEDTLRELAPSHPMIPLLLQYRQLFKLVSTYVDALPRFVGSDGRVHSTFNVEGAATGRLSSQNPNLQNIPVKGEMGGEIRKAFVAPIGKILLAADYSQIELRILAHLAQDPGLIKAFNEGLDIHAATASKIFNVPVEKVTKEQRMVGKTMNFATLYGQGAHALARQLGVDYATAQKYIEEYFAQFPKVRVWKAEVLENAKRNGYVETLWGRKRYIPELSAANRQIQAFGERAAINHPVQGTAADMIKKAMVEIDKSLLNIVDRISGEKKTINDKRLTINGLYSMILQVHDELLFECIPDNVGEVGKMVKDKMENALKLSVPVLVDLKVGPNWGEMKALNH
ncbi:MAG: DNA-directed DNA polymerase I [Candidatus Daviesbacteria bacterium GW2011_GWB1_41_5]|uniref:DNA-directed DNA polymerase n=1 Tax=Candidatus Daviesbacteria bacterium GW2011_GWB1_41_5 TaxID=1618429 RepID=A0A0G0YWM9_9BACT|nr:MAG: DNA-directed DNA polymerase I [Candidatus Daviesbacteria bacterium GW2011_GWB1_41_5]